jgi:hypothetical protein
MMKHLYPLKKTNEKNKNDITQIEFSSTTKEKWISIIIFYSHDFRLSLLMIQITISYFIKHVVSKNKHKH